MRTIKLLWLSLRVWLVLKLWPSEYVDTHETAASVTRTRSFMFGNPAVTYTLIVKVWKKEILP